MSMVSAWSKKLTRGYRIDEINVLETKEDDEGS
jgi:hypothetical protein